MGGSLSGRCIWGQVGLSSHYACLGLCSSSGGYQRKPLSSEQTHRSHWCLGSPRVSSTSWACRHDVPSMLSSLHNFLLGVLERHHFSCPPLLGWLVPRGSTQCLASALVGPLDQTPHRTALPFGLWVFLDPGRGPTEVDKVDCMWGTRLDCLPLVRPCKAFCSTLGIFSTSLDFESGCKHPA